jgi:RNA recognition motif-containing protein
METEVQCEPRLSLSLAIEASVLASLADKKAVDTLSQCSTEATVVSPSGRVERMSSYLKDEAERTTLMIRNIPNGMTQAELLEEIELVVPGVNFLYLPQSRTRSGNVGYAFVNFTTSEQAVDCIQEFQDTKFRHFNKSKKTIEVGYATLQGFQQNVRFYRRSKVCRSKNRPYMKFN